MCGFARASEPGRFWVDSFPLCGYSVLQTLPSLADFVGLVRHVPSWVPGAGFKVITRRMREDLERLYDVPFDFVKTKMVSLILQ